MIFQHIFRHMVPTDTLKNIVEPRLKKYDQIFTENTCIKATYEYVGKNFTVKITVRAKNKLDLFAVETSHNAYIALDKALMKIERQLIKRKEKRVKKIRDKVTKEFIHESPQVVGF